MIEIVWAGPPRWWEKGRPRPIQFVVVHDTEGSEGASSAEAGVAYDKRRDDSVSCHIMLDTDTALREVNDADTAYGSMYHGNAIGIQVELCHAGVWNLSDPADAATFDNAAQVVAQLCATHGLPAVRLTIDQVRAAWYAAPADRPRGICGHVDVTYAYPEDGGDHTDPGPTFPWAEFIKRVQQYMEGNMALTQADADLCAKTLLQAWLGHSGPSVGAALQNAISDAAAQKTVSREEFTDLSAKVDKLLAAVLALPSSVSGLVDHTHAVGAGGTVSVSGSTGPAVASQ